MSQLLDLFPPGSATDADGMLIIGGCRADDLAAEFGTPVLVVAEESASRAGAGIRSGTVRQMVQLAGRVRLQGVPVHRGSKGHGAARDSASMSPAVARS